MLRVQFMNAHMPGTLVEADHIRVLMVEDDRLLRMLAVEILLDDGIAATGVAGAAEALEYLESSQDVELLVTDVNMPGMSGTNLAMVVQQRFPRVRLLIVSGREQPRADSLQRPVEFMQKPFSALSFLTRVKALLDS